MIHASPSAVPPTAVPVRAVPQRSSIRLGSTCSKGRSNKFLRADSLGAQSPFNGVKLAAASSLAIAQAFRRRRRRGPQGGKGPQGEAVISKSLIDDTSMVVTEALNTVEDAYTHFLRQTSGAQPSSKKDVLWTGAQPSGAMDPNLVRSPLDRKRVVVLGTGWAAHAMSKVIDQGSCEVMIVSPRNYFIFTPMLAAASVGTVEYRSIVEHIRTANPCVSFVQGTCEEVDAEAHEIRVRPFPASLGAEFTLKYDVLVVAVGVKPSPLGVPGVHEHCFFLKGIEDARRIRRRVTERFESADIPGVSDSQKRKLLTFAVVGGGPTGCEFCGELSDFVQKDLRRFYPALDQFVRIVLVHRGKTILPSFSEDLQRSARETLESQGIEVWTSSGVKEVGDGFINLQREDRQERLDCGLCMWAAGQEGQDIVSALGKGIPEQGKLSSAQARGDISRLFVDDWLRVAGVKDGSILAIGDCARIAHQAPLPQTAQVAAQQGSYVARLLNRNYDMSSEKAPYLPKDTDLLKILQARFEIKAPTFRFLNLGQLAYIGEEKAVAEFGVGSTSVSSASGTAAFILWRSVYIVKQVSFRNRLLVLFDWAKSRVFGRDLTRL
ncbi:unnamed protein product [Polarella glacialis]|uniref:Uncharacterized protein n=1 Tax=Polarella glacialis TaxID=89957 RepID=A0A813L9B9_POLGL|nr:unnamed protein product [Polarella glacialis]